jgi:1-acyl-sn-glycerol-3-phosphate acyltransferase
MGLSVIAPYRFTWFDWFCLWYPPAWLILFNRHWQHYKPDPEGWSWLEYPLLLVPGGFYIALLIRWLRLGLRSPRSLPVPPDPEYQQAFRTEILAPIVQRYFQGTLHQLENLPTHGPVIVAMNHAGMCFPWDFVALGLLLSQQRDWFVQPLAHPIFFEHPWLVWWLPAGWTQTLGGVRAELQHFEQAIADKPVLLYAPEGWRGLSKGWRRRYRLATFHPSFIRLSIRHQIPILPVTCMGSEYLHPFAVNVRRLAHWLKMPLFPISPLVLLFLLFPSLGVWAVRTRLSYYIQPIWHPWEELEAQNRQLPSHSVAYRMADKLRSRLQIAIQRLRRSDAN